MNPDNAENVDESLYHYLINQSSKMVAENKEDVQGTISNLNIQYYYRLEKVQTTSGVIVLVSFMDDAYPQSIRNTLSRINGVWNDFGLLYFYHYHDDLGIFHYSSIKSNSNRILRKSNKEKKWSCI